MLGIVLVTHSATLAEGVRELAAQMTGGRVPIAVAGGTSNADDPIGTDPARVLEAIERVYSTDGVLVLMDLGSAIMSAEAALEFLDPAQREHIYLCEAPLVEGAIVAAAGAAGGRSIVEVMAEARSALGAKLAQLEPLLRSTAPAEPAETPASSPGEVQTSTLTVPNRLGLHARPAARLVELVGRYSASVRLVRGSRSADAHSINEVATLGARQGDDLLVQAAGPDAAAVLAAIEALAGENFGDVDTPAPTSLLPPGEVRGVPASGLRGIAASPGFAAGPVVFLHTALPAVEAQAGADPAVEWAELQAVLQQVDEELLRSEAAARRQLGADEAGIFAAHRLMLRDPALLRAVQQALVEQGISAAAAWQQTLEATAAAYRNLDDPYLRARAVDVTDAGGRVLARLLGSAALSPQLDTPAILAARELTPSDVAVLDPERVLGIVAELGGPTDHAAVLARALGIPAVVGLGAAFEEIAAAPALALDGGAGMVWPAPDAAMLAEFTARRQAWRGAAEATAAQARQPAATRDGRRIEVFANISSLVEAQRATALGAEGVGVFRTEFLFMGRTAPPDEAEQTVVYSAAAQALAGRPLIVRTLDIGGDKPVAYLPMVQEANPFLGLRGIRYTLAAPDLLRTQLRALLRAAAQGAVAVLFPMISTLDELLAAKALLADERAKLEGEGVTPPRRIPLGVMIEVPSAVLTAAALAPHVDFFSIGTNDLTQYLLASDRSNAAVAGLVNSFQPAVVRALRQVVEVGHAAGIRVAVCGEMAGDPRAAALLVGLGVDELSMNATAIGAVKASIRSLESRAAVALAERALQADTLAEVEALLAGGLG